MNANHTWFKSSRPTLSITRRKLAPLVEAVEDRKLMTTGCASGFLAGSVLLDGNGVGVSCVKIDLYKPGCNTPIASQSTDCNGQYVFTGLKPGDYFLKESLPRGYHAVGTDINSQLNPAMSVDSKTIKVTVVDPTKVYVNYGGIINGSFGVINDVVKGIANVNSVGPMSDTLGTSAGDASLNGGFQTFCVNDLQSLSFSGGESYRVTPRPISQLNDGSCTISTERSGRIAYLFNHYGNDSLSSVEGAGLQVAIWELLYDKGNTPNFAKGAFQVTGSDPAYTDQATLDQIIAQAKAYYVESCGHSETAVFLDAACANPGRTEGLQSVLCTSSLNFTIGKSRNQCGPTNLHHVIDSCPDFDSGHGFRCDTDKDKGGPDCDHDADKDRGKGGFEYDRDKDKDDSDCDRGRDKDRGGRGSSCDTGGWGGGWTSSCNVGTGKGWSQGNTFSWCKR